MTNNLTDIKAVIFDMDGLMIDTENLWVVCAQKLSTEYGYNIPQNLIIESIGRRVFETKQAFNDFFKDTQKTEKFFADYKLITENELKTNGMVVKKGLFELLDFLKNNNFKIAIASSSLKNKVLRYLSYAKIDYTIFDNIICGDMVTKPKPNPDIYIRSCAELNVPTSQTLVLEDSNIGVQAGYSAGIKVVFIQDVLPLFAENAQKIYKQVNSLDQVIQLLQKS